MNVSDCMKRKVVSIEDTATIGEAVDRFASNHIGMLPVVNTSGRLVGILHLRDLLDLVMPAFVDLVDDFDFVRDFGVLEQQQPTQQAIDKPVKSLMEDPTSVRSSCGLLRAFAIINSHELLDLPVVDDHDRLIGLASRVDIGRALLTSWHHDASKGRSSS
jgi:CBS-domain-containing membrane protein